MLQPTSASFGAAADKKTSGRGRQRSAVEFDDMGQPIEKREAYSDTVKQYLREIGRFPLLTKEDEQRLAAAIAKGRDAQARLDSPPDDYTDQQRVADMRLVRLGAKAKTDFINANLRLVVSIAKRYRTAVKGKMEFLDLIQEGNIGLEHGVDKFDAEKGFKFSTYGTWWIRQAITRAIANQRSEIRLPVHAGDDVRRLQKGMEDHMTPEEIMAKYNWDEDKFAQVQNDSIVTSTTSFDTPLGYESETTLGDMIPDNRQLADYKQAEIAADSEQIIQIIRDNLPERLAEILLWRFGFYSDGEQLKSEEVSKHFNLSKERIRQLEAKAMAILRHPALYHRVGPLRALLNDS